MITAVFITIPTTNTVTHGKLFQFAIIAVIVPARPITTTALITQPAARWNVVAVLAMTQIMK